jgi:PhzF family phenazine biosynthesis protein
VIGAGEEFAMKTLAFQQVDVFTTVPFQGNPVAVVLDGDPLSGAQMQTIAAWTNLSETTFVCSPADPRADYRLRIFTPKRELPFAGHPTIGSAHAVLRHGRKPRTADRLVQECGKGLVDVRIDGERLLLALPEPRFLAPAPSQLAAVADALGVGAADVQGAATIDVGAAWLTLRLASADVVRALRPDMGKLAAVSPSGLIGVTVFARYPEGADGAIEVRSFAPGEGVPEDPVCGSGNGCVAALIRRDGLLKTPTYVARQGRCLGRDGRVTVELDADTIWLGGHAVTCVEGVLSA